MPKEYIPENPSDDVAYALKIDGTYFCLTDRSNLLN